jgi:hypothetical protein
MVDRKTHALDGGKRLECLGYALDLDFCHGG